MSVDITIQETVNDVDITVVQNVITVNVTRTTGSGGVESVTGDLVNNTDPLNPVVGVPNLTQVLTVGDLLIWNSGIGSDTFLTLQLGDELTENYFNTSGVGTGGIFLDKDVIFPNNSTIRFQAGFAEDGGGSVTLDSYKFTTDAHVYYQGAEVTDITIQPSDVCMLKCAGLGGDGVQVWILTVVNKSTSSGGGTWGSITGTLADQTDLQTALDGKVDKVAGSRLITSAESTLLGNTSGTNTGDNATNTTSNAYADAKVANDLTASTTVAPSKTAVLTEYDMITGLTFSGVFSLDKKGGRSYLPYTQTGSLTLSIGGSPIVGGFAVLRFTANGSAISGFSGWKLLSSDAITATNGVVHRVIVYQYEDEIWYSVKLN